MVDPAIIVAAITALGTVVVATITARSNATNRDILARLEHLEDEMHESAVIGARNDLLLSMRTTPENTVEILKIARRYFLELHGDSYASLPFVKWAFAHQIKIDRFFSPQNDLEFLAREYEAKVKVKEVKNERNA